MSDSGEETKTEKLRKKREQRNRQLLDRMRDSNDSLAAITDSATFFPPRPIIKKDKKEIERLYGSTQTTPSNKHQWQPKPGTMIYHCARCGNELISPEQRQNDCNSGTSDHL